MTKYRLICLHTAAVLVFLATALVKASYAETSIINTPEHPNLPVSKQSVPSSQAYPLTPPSMPSALPDVAKTTLCPGEDKIWEPEKDNDVVIKAGSNLTVMFHGNRFPASADIVNAFEKANPGIKVSYSSLPPISVIRKVNEHDLAK